jgi:hypothetical protein
VLPENGQENKTFVSFLCLFCVGCSATLWELTLSVSLWKSAFSFVAFATNDDVLIFTMAVLRKSLIYYSAKKA